MSNRQKIIRWGGVALLVVAVFYFFYYSQGMKLRQEKGTTVTIGKTTVVVDVADTPALREHGLSGREGLQEGKGMLFVFPEPGSYGFWMKDMQFPIDIIWADSSGVVNTVTPNIAPYTYPQAFYPTAPVLYVLEVPAGYAEAHKIGVGAKIVVQ